MNIGLYQSAASLSALERWQDAVSQNITSSQVAGFRKRTVEFSSIKLGELRSDPKAKGDYGDKESAMFPTTTLGISFQPGETEPTGRDLDVALEGEGFFEVQLPDGSRGYTRAGELHLSNERMLLTRDNVPLLSQAGTPITLQAGEGDLSIAHDGSINQGSNQLGKLSVVKFADSSALTPRGGGLFTAGPDVASSQVEKPMVLQGYTEGSNVSPLHEMISLVQISRAYEANQKILTSRDQTMQKALEALG